MIISMNRTRFHIISEQTLQNGKTKEGANKEYRHIIYEYNLDISGDISPVHIEKAVQNILKYLDIAFNNLEIGYTEETKQYNIRFTVPDKLLNEQYSVDYTNEGIVRVNL